MTLYNKKTAAHPMCNPYVSYTNKFKLQVPCQFREHHRTITKTSMGFLWATASSLQATRPLRDLKECDGTHSERSASPHSEESAQA